MDEDWENKQRKEPPAKISGKADAQPAEKSAEKVYEIKKTCIFQGKWDPL